MKGNLYNGYDIDIYNTSDTWVSGVDYLRFFGKDMLSCPHGSLDVLRPEARRGSQYGIGDIASKYFFHGIEADEATIFRDVYFSPCFSNSFISH
jgi:hypothetical protein